MFFILYIYKLAKDNGKSLEIHIHNYRQLQTIIDTIIQLYGEYNYSKYRIEIDNNYSQKKQYKNSKILTIKKGKNRHKQHSIIIENTIIETLLIKSYPE